MAISAFYAVAIGRAFFPAQDPVVTQLISVANSRRRSADFRAIHQMLHAGRCEPGTSGENAGN
jgi:hypothetical protein